MVGDVGRALLQRGDFAAVDAENVGDQRRGRRLRAMFTTDVFRGELFSVITVACARASADEMRSVADDPLLSFSVKVKSRSGVRP